jgi:hypothetical protein
MRAIARSRRAVPDRAATCAETDCLAAAEAIVILGLETGKALRTFHITFSCKVGSVSGPRFTRLNMRKTIRILGVLLAMVALLVFATDFVSDWHNDNSANDGQCPYCHVNCQAPAQPEVTRCGTVLALVAFLPLPEDAVPPTGPICSQTSSRAPPLA